MIRLKILFNQDFSSVLDEIYLELALYLLFARWVILHAFLSTEDSKISLECHKHV